MPDIVVLPALSPRAIFLRERLVTINKTAGEMILENGLLLREMKVNAIFKELGYDTFDSAIDSMHDQGQLDYGARNARYFIAIVDMIEKLCLDEADTKNLGVSKLREISSIRDEKDQRKLLEAAGDMSVSEVQAEAKAIRDRAAGRDVDPLTPRNLRFSETQAACFDATIAATRTVHGINDNVPVEAILIDVIMADWYSGLPALSDGTIVLEAGAGVS